jgi:hypothetical protein
MDSDDGMQFRDQLTFWGIKVLPGKQAQVNFDEQEEALVHITQASTHPPTALHRPCPPVLAGGLSTARTAVCFSQPAAALSVTAASACADLLPGHRRGCSVADAPVPASCAGPRWRWTTRRETLRRRSSSRSAARKLPLARCARASATSSAYVHPCCLCLRRTGHVACCTRAYERVK